MQEIYASLIFLRVNFLFFLYYQQIEDARIVVVVFHFRAWNSNYRKIFNKSFDSRTSYGSSSQIVQFYDEHIGTGSVLGVYRDLETNRIHFVVNEKKRKVSFSSGAPDFCFGYVRLKAIGSDGKIQVTVPPEVKGNRSPNQVLTKVFPK